MVRRWHRSPLFRIIIKNAAQEPRRTAFGIRFQRFYSRLLVSQGRFLNDYRLGHVIGSRRMLGQSLRDQCFGISVAWPAIALHPAQALEQILNRVSVFVS